MKIKSKREEIINACASLYETMSFKDITIREIGNLLPFARPTIYNYFKTKEEIFLALLQREYELWSDELTAMSAGSPDEFAQKLARSLEKRERLLKLMSMNHFDMEANSRLENLIEFKKAYGNSMKAAAKCLEKFCPALSAIDRQDFIYSFFPFVYGIYPYVHVTDKQRDAMAEAGVNYVYLSIYDIAYTCAKKLLKI